MYLFDYIVNIRRNIEIHKLSYVKVLLNYSSLSNIPNKVYIKYANNDNKITMYVINKISGYATLNITYNINPIIINIDLIILICFTYIIILYCCV